MEALPQARSVDAAAHGPTRAVVSHTLTEEAETYNSSVAGVEIHAIRAGPDRGPTEVLAAIGDQFTFNANKVGFPMLSQSTIPDDLIAVAHIRAAPPGSRWCEIDLEPGAILVYGPQAEHLARNPPGTEFMFATFDVAQLNEYADQLGTRIDPPPPGWVHQLAGTANHVRPAFSAFADAAASGEFPPSAIADDVLRAVTHDLAEKGRPRRVGYTSRIDSRDVVRRCIDYANAVDRIPSTSELCLAAHVSERRLRQAFTDEFDLPPSQYFRMWALDMVHNRLVLNEACDTTVTWIAQSLGFGHLGRFAGRYKQIYGESPSMTLHS